MEDSSIQKLFKFFLPKDLADDMEAQSRSWKVQCENCKYERSVWEMGGIRWKAAGNPRVYRVCPQCGVKGWHLVYRRP